nr:sulfite exporter TauE/SafE family protein [Hoeflea prorocentri]
MAGSIVQSGLGMGFGLTVAPLLALLNPELVPAPTLFLGMLTAAWGALAERAHIRWNEVAVATGGRLIGAVLGLVLLLIVSTASGFSLLFGAMVLVAVGLSAAGRSLPFNWGSLGSMGFISGAMGTITSVGAPPLALVYQGREPDAARATLAAFFAIGCGISLAGLYWAGWAGWRDAALALAMLPPMFAGLWVARFFRLRFLRWYRPWLLGVAGMAGILLVLRGLT